MKLVHLLLMDDGKFTVPDSVEASAFGEWCGVHQMAFGQVSEIVKWAEDQGAQRPVAAASPEAYQIQSKAPMAEAVKKKDMSAGKEHGASPLARAEACCVDLGIAKDKRNVGVIREAIEESVRDYELVILQWDSETETEAQKLGAWNKLVNMIRTKGQ